MGYALPDPQHEIRELASQNAAFIAVPSAYAESSSFDCARQIEQMQRNLLEATTLWDNTRLAQQLRGIKLVDSDVLKHL